MEIILGMSRETYVNENAGLSEETVLFDIENESATSVWMNRFNKIKDKKISPSSKGNCSVYKIDDEYTVLKDMLELDSGDEYFEKLGTDILDSISERYRNSEYLAGVFKVMMNNGQEFIFVCMIEKESAVACKEDLETVKVLNLDSLKGFQYPYRNDAFELEMDKLKLVDTTKISIDSAFEDSFYRVLSDDEIKENILQELISPLIDSPSIFDLDQKEKEKKRVNAVCDVESFLGEENKISEEQVEMVSVKFQNEIKEKGIKADTSKLILDEGKIKVEFATHEFGKAIKIDSDSEGVLTITLNCGQLETKGAFKPIDFLRLGEYDE